MRALSANQEMALLRDQIARICAAGCPETTRLPERAWLLVHKALELATAEERAAPDRASAAPMTSERTH